MTADLEGVELDVAIADNLTIEVLPHLAQWKPDGATDWEPIPDWHASLDAIMRDIWPVLADTGWTREFNEDGKSVWWGIWDQSGYTAIAIGEARWAEPNPEALALARACHEALAALKEDPS